MSKFSLSNFDFSKRSTMLMVALAVAVTATTVTALFPFGVVPTGSRGVVTQYGRIVGVEEEGLVFVPFWRKLAVFNIRGERAETKSEGSTRDTQPVNVELVVYYNIIPNKVAEVYERFSHDGDLSTYVNSAAQESFKSATSMYTAPELITKRSEVSSAVRKALEAKLSIYGATVINVDMKSFAFSPQYMAAVNEKATQEQLRMAAENELKTVEAKLKQKSAVAEAEASAQHAKADGDAYATTTTAKAQAEALKLQGSALAANPSVLELRRIDVNLRTVELQAEVQKAQAAKWNGSVPQQMFAGAPIPFVNTPPIK